jgi:hypothetical protein
MSTDVSDKRSYRFKSRKITACSECYRRKQKCNRQRPCNYCTDRGVPSRCTYGSQNQHDHSRIATPATERIDVDGDDASDDFLDLTNTLGYARDSPRQHVPYNNFQLPRMSGNPAQAHKTRALLQELPNATIMQILVDVFFTQANWYFTVLDRTYFDQKLRAWSLLHTDFRQTASANVLWMPALLFQVLALACQFVTPDVARRVLQVTRAGSLDDLSTLYSETGEEVATLFGRHLPSVTSVEADLMRCAWLKNCGRGAEAWYSLGNVVRQAQDLRLHQEPPATSDLSSQWTAEYRRRLWACIFTWESHMALQLGRARMINTSDCTVNCPLDCDIPENPSRTLLTIPTPDEPPSHFTSAVVKCRLSQMIHELMNAGCFRSEQDKHSYIIQAHQSVDNLISELPRAVSMTNTDTSWDLRYPELVRHRLMIAIITSSFLLSIHRPYVSQHEESRDSAVTAAIEVLSQSQKLFEITEPHQYKLYTNTFYSEFMSLKSCIDCLLSRSPARHPICERLSYSMTRPSKCSATKTLHSPSLGLVIPGAILQALTSHMSLLLR